MSRIWVITLLVLVGANTGRADAAMTRAQVDGLLAVNKTKPVGKRSEIPKEWQQAMRLDDANAIADIGAAFDAGCTGPEPHARLITTVVAEPFAFAVVETGGIAHLMTLHVYERRTTIVEVYTEVLRDKRLGAVCKALDALKACGAYLAP